jgi:hypothetical protein
MMDWTETINQLKVEIFFFTVLFAILFFQIQQASVKTLLSMLLITAWLGVLWYYLQYKGKKLDSRDKQEKQILDKENTERLETPEIVSHNYYVKTAPKKGLSYLKKNELLMKMAQDLIFVRTFDAQKYQEMLVFMNHYQKVYMYILAERYPCQSYVPTLLDLRENILEIMYQYYLVVPKTFKHIYGVDPYAVIEKNIHLFLKLSRTMLEVLENFCRLDLKEHYFPMTGPMPYDAKRQQEKQNLLP